MFRFVERFTMKVVKTSDGERGISFDQDEVLAWSTVRDAYRFSGCKERLSKELADHFFVVVTTLVSEGENTLEIKEKAKLYDTEQRREERKHLRVLGEISKLTK
jgi:ABC-type taurine transport system ATPase subunit